MKYKENQNLSYPPFSIESSLISVVPSFCINRSKTSGVCATWRYSSGFNDRSFIHFAAQTANAHRPNIHDLIQNVFRRWFSQQRKAIRRDELYAPSCQRLTRPAPFAVLYVRTAFYPVGAPSCFSQTVPDTSTDSRAGRGNLIYCSRTVEHFFLIGPENFSFTVVIETSCSCFQSSCTFFFCFQALYITKRWTEVDNSS